MNLIAKAELQPLVDGCISRRELPSLTSRRRFLKVTASTLLLSGSGSVMLTACGGGLASDQVPTPRLATLDNFRDVGGAAGGYLTVDGRQVRRGVFYRSGALTESAADKATLDALAIAAVYDLRTPGEITRAADLLPAGALYQNINVTGRDDLALLSPDSAASAVMSMEGAERLYVSDSLQRAAYGTLLAQLAGTRGAQLIHSSAGKDRAGWVAALLLSIANVPFDVIMQDYLLTNAYSAASIAARIQARREKDGDVAATVEAPLAGVQSSFLQAGFDQVQASYGTMSNYLTRGLGLTQSTIDALRDRLLV